MGLEWHLARYVAQHDTPWEALAELMGYPVGRDLRGSTPPIDLSLAVIADLCQALGCQPGDLLTFTPDSPQEQAARHLASHPTYQSFLAFKEAEKGSREG